MKRFILVVITIYVQSVCAQELCGLGCVYDPIADGNALRTATLLTRDYVSLPRAYSLKKYCPQPKSQERYGTCTSWATAYAARTICEAISLGWTNTENITAEAFSPIFVYKNIDKVSECEDGISIAKALELIKTTGVPKYTSFPVLCADYVPRSLFDEAQRYRIDGYTKLFDQDYNWTTKKWEDNTPASVKLSTIKKAISQNHPVVISMNCYESFSVWGESVWNGIQDKFRSEGERHALCVVGYDDDKFGGAFEIMNSWGTRWGDGGFIWVRYEDFCKNTPYAYDVYVAKRYSPVPPPKTNKLSGEVRIQLGGGKNVQTTQKTNGNITYFALTGSYLVGQQYRIYMSNNEPGYLYLIGSDEDKNDVLLFPAKGESPLLAYNKNNIAFPNEQTNIKMNKGPKEYLCFLFSKKELDISSFMDKTRNSNGSFYSRITKAIGSDMIPSEDVKLTQNNKMSFNALSDYSIFPLFVEYAVNE